MKCIICNKTARQIDDNAMQWHFYHCESCAFFFKDRSQLLYGEAEKRIYDNHDNTLDSPGYVRMFEDFIDFCIQERLETIKNVLEFGSGPGPVLSMLLENLGLHVRKYDKFYYNKTIRDEERFELITSTEVIEHIDDIHAVFTLFSKHLRCGGYLAIMTQFHNNNAEEFLHWWYRKDPTHISFFTPQTFKILAHSHGFNIVKSDGKKTILLTKESS